jgi:hypothetical protein
MRRQGRDERERRLDLVGRDMARGELGAARRLRVSPGLIVVVLVAGLAVAALRVDLIRVRYGLAEALGQEKALLDDRREALARLRALRDPARLARLADEHGLTRPAQIFDLPLLPAVAAAPAASRTVAQAPPPEAEPAGAER